MDNAPAQQTGHPTHQHHSGPYPGAAHPHNQREVGDQPVIGAEDRSPEAAGELLPAAGGQRPDHFLVDLLIGGHPAGGVKVLVVWGLALCALGKGEHEYRAEDPGHPAQQHPVDGGAGQLVGVRAQQLAPVLLVPLLRCRQPQKDLTFLAGFSPRQLLVERGLSDLISQVLPPAPNLFGRRGRAGGLGSGVAVHTLYSAGKLRPASSCSAV